MADSLSSLPLSEGWNYSTYATLRKSSHYKEIGHDVIRLLKIVNNTESSSTHAASNNPPLTRCVLETFPRDQAPSYAALSYTWGAGWADCQILLNGQIYSIRRNLHRFLLHAARLKTVSIDWLWIDAICIDQDDLEERAAQVEQMASVYSSAKRVIVWLGPAYQNSDVALTYLESIANDVAKPHYRIWGDKTGQAISYLCGRQFWTRLWVLQELMLAQDICLMCGDACIAWTSLVDFLIALDHTSHASRKHSPDYEHTRTSPAMSMTRQVIAQGENRDLLKVMQRTHQLRCGQLRDKVFALLGIVNDRGGLQVDYTVPVIVLLNSVLREAYKRRRPVSLKQVLDDCDRFEQWFQLQPGSLFDAVDSVGTSTTMVQGKDNLSYKRLTYWWALHYNHTAVQKLFLREEIVTDQALWFAVKNDDPVTLQTLLDALNYNVNREDMNGDTMLHVAIRAASTAALAVLLRQPDIDVNVSARDTFTPLHTALQYRASVLEYNKSLYHIHESDDSLQDFSSRTVLDRSIFHEDESSRQEREIQMSATEDMQASDHGFNDSSSRSSANRPRPYEDGSSDQDWKSQMSAVDELPETLYSVQSSASRSMEDRRSDQGWSSPISGEDMDVSLAMIEMLLQTGKVDIDYEPRRGAIAIFKAGRMEDTATFQLLLDAGALRAEVQSGLSQWAPALLFDLVRRETSEILKVLLESRPFLAQTKDEHGNPATFVAVQKDCILVLKILLDNGCPTVLTDCGTKTGRTILHEAVLWDVSLTMIDFIIASGTVDKHAIAMDGRTADELARDRKNASLVKHLRDVHSMGVLRAAEPIPINVMARTPSSESPARGAPPTGQSAAELLRRHNLSGTSITHMGFQLWEH